MCQCTNDELKIITGNTIEGYRPHPEMAQRFCPYWLIPSPRGEGRRSRLAVVLASGDEGNCPLQQTKGFISIF